MASPAQSRILMGYKFRRQHPIGPYIVDFACTERRLVVELDGGHHDASRDAGRMRYLQAQGFMALRFWNNDVFRQQDAVLAMIFEALSRSRPLPASVANKPTREF